MSWLQLLLKETDDAETPRSFIYWAGICTISAIVSPHVFLNRQVYQLRPNIYCLLIARSGLGKGLPTSLAKELVQSVKTTRVVSGRSTIQVILKDLSLTQSNEDKSPTIQDARGFIVSGEFATALQRDPDAFTILTDLYDTHYNSEWVNSTKSGGVEKLKSPCVTLFSGASPEHFSDFVPKVNMFGGFIGRTLLVYEDKRWKINPLTNENAPTIDMKGLREYLNKLKKVKGAFHWSIEGKKTFEEWYYDFRPRKFEDKTGTVERMPDHILKVAMCISLSKNTDLILTDEDIKEAIESCMALGVTAKRITSGTGQSNQAAQTKAVLEIVLRTEGFKISRKDLLMRGFGDFDSIELDRIVETLTQAGFLEQVGVKDIVYHVTPTGQNLWKKNLEEK